MAKYPGTLETNNINEYGIVKADQIQGHRIVDSPEDLTKLTAAQVSIDKTNENNKGAIWYSKSDDQFYYLGGTFDDGSPSNSNNWFPVLTFLKDRYHDGNYHPIQYIRGKGANAVNIDGITTVNGYFLGVSTNDNSFLTKSQIGDLVSTYMNPSNYLEVRNYLTQYDINSIIQSCL